MQGCINSIMVILMVRSHIEFTMMILVVIMVNSLITTQNLLNFKVVCFINFDAKVLCLLLFLDLGFQHQLN